MPGRYIPEELRVVVVSVARQGASTAASNWQQNSYFEEMEGRRGNRKEEPDVDTLGGAVLTGDDGSDGGEFEFSFASNGASATGDAAADELFADGRIRAFYPVFGRAIDDAHAPPALGRRPLGRLFLEDERNSSVSSSSSSSAAADLDGFSPDSYCVWVPGASPSRSPQKSSSTGSMARWRRVSEFVVGRSHSDGKDKFHFLSAPPSPAREIKGKPRGGAGTEIDTVAANHRIFYGAKASPGAPRRTFLPYRQDLVGLFSQAKGPRNHHHL